MKECVKRNIYYILFVERLKNAEKIKRVITEADERIVSRIALVKMEFKQR